jgi:predicted ArsR family transcriptional regulator
MEETMMAQVLNAKVELTHCMMDGHNGCSFVVSNW